MDVPIALHEKRSLCSLEQELFSRIVVSLHWGIQQAIELIALWLWLEEQQFPNIIDKLLALSVTDLTFVVEEAIVCLNCVYTGELPAPVHCDIPWTTSLLGMHIPLKFFSDNKKNAMERIKMITEAMISSKHFSSTTSSTLMTTMPNGESSSNRTVVDVGRTQINNPIALPKISPQSMLNVNAKPWNVKVPVNDKTMFLTFSRGHSLSEEEVRDFLTSKFGDCIQSIIMQRVTSPIEEPLYARVVFKLASTIAVVLGGMDKAKFIYKGKHIWARRWERRDQYRVLQLGC